MSRRATAWNVSLFAAILLALPGCTSRVNLEKSLTLEPGAKKETDVKLKVKSL